MKGVHSDTKGKQIQMTLPKNELVAITPEMAALWLTRNTNNRTISRPRVEAMADDMRAGKFQLTHQGIAFGADGELFDGQHRLAAVVKANVAVSMYVTRGLPASTRIVIDANQRARSPSDVLKMFEGIENSRPLVARVNVIECIDGRTKQSRVVSADQVKTVYAKYKTGLDWTLELFPATAGLDQAPVTGTLAWAHSLSPTKIEAFGEALKSGANLQPKSPVLTLRNVVLDRKLYTQGKNFVLPAIRKVMAALQAFMENRTLERLYDSETAMEFWKRLKKDLSVFEDS